MVKIHQGQKRKERKRKAVLHREAGQVPEQSYLQTRRVSSAPSRSSSSSQTTSVGRTVSSQTTMAGRTVAGQTAPAGRTVQGQTAPAGRTIQSQTTPAGSVKKPITRPPSLNVSRVKEDK